MSGAKRTVQLGSMSYVDPNGRVRWADCGVEVEIHPDHVARFDEFNVLVVPEVSDIEPDQPVAEPETEPEPAPKRRPGRPRKEG